MAASDHYLCALPHKRHIRCPVAPGHSGSTFTCSVCRAGYVRAFMAPDATKTRYREARRRRRADHPHYACDLPPEAHPIKRGVGRDHRAGCAVAEGHTPGASAGSRSCDRCHLDTIKKHYRRNTLRRVFGLSLEEYDGLLKSQEGGCAICGRTTEIALAVDHDHATGSVRGLLCRECNLGLGNFMDDPALLDAASSYLRKVVMRP